MYLSSEVNTAKDLLPTNPGPYSSSEELWQYFHHWQRPTPSLPTRHTWLKEASWPPSRPAVSFSITAFLPCPELPGAFACPFQPEVYTPPADMLPRRAVLKLCGFKHLSTLGLGTCSRGKHKLRRYSHSWCVCAHACRSNFFGSASVQQLMPYDLSWPWP